jgi:hypothetical protein
MLVVVQKGLRALTRGRAGHGKRTVAKLVLDLPQATATFSSLLAFGPCSALTGVMKTSKQEGESSHEKKEKS